METLCIYCQGDRTHTRTSPGKKRAFCLMLAMMLVCVSGNAQMSVSGRILRADYGLKGTVKSVTEAHWDEDGLFFGRQNNVFSRTGKVLEETVYFGEGENDIESTRLCKYNSDGSLSGCYAYRRGGEAHAVLEHFAHWVAVYDQKGHLVRKHVLEFEPKADKYGNPIWHRTGEEVFAVADGPQASDTLYTFDKKTGRTTTMRWSTDDGDMTATFAYTASGDTLSIVYDDTTGHLPTRVDYEYKYASTLEKEREKNRETARPQGNTGRAVSPVLEKRKQEAAKKSKKKLGRWLSVTAFAATIVFAIFAYNIYGDVQKPNVDLRGRKSAYLYVHTGCMYADVVKMLKDSNFVIDIESFDWVARQKNYPQLVKAGRFKIRNGMSNNQLINMLRSGAQEPVKVTIGKSRSIMKIAEAIAAKIEVDESELYMLLNDNAFLSKYGKTRETAFTFFIPDTYYFNFCIVIICFSVYLAFINIIKRCGREYFCISAKAYSDGFYLAKLH